MVNRLRDKIWRKKNLEILSTTDGKKKLKIDPRNLEFSEVFPDEQSGDLRFSREHAIVMKIVK
jgi:hypothetical protein